MNKEVRNNSQQLDFKPESRLVEGIIYCYTSPNGKRYIGQTVNPKARMRQHKNCYGGNYFHKAIKKYGFENFIYDELIRVKSYNQDNLKLLLNTLEKFYIRKYKSSDNRFGYNLTEGGEGSTGYKHTDESKRKMSEFQKGKIPWNKGKQMSEEQKQKLKEIDHYWARGATCKVAKSVAKYDIEMNLLEVYGTVTEAANSIGKLPCALSYALKNHTPYKNYYWYYEGDQK